VTNGRAVGAQGEATCQPGQRAGAGREIRRGAEPEPGGQIRIPDQHHLLGRLPRHRDDPLEECAAGERQAVLGTPHAPARASCQHHCPHRVS